MQSRWFLPSMSIVLALFCLVPVVTAQAVHQYARPGYATKTVYVWGAVASPGLWEIEQEIGLVEFLTVLQAQGLAPGQRSILRIFREEGGRRNEIFRENLKDVLVGNQSYPVLQDGDIVTVETRSKIGWQSIVSLIGTASSISLLLINILRLTTS